MNSFKKQLRILLGLGCLLAGTSTTACAAPGAGDFVDLIGVRVTDVKGHHHRIGVSTGKVRAAALVFLDTACPVATRYIPALNELHDDAQARGVSLYGVLSNPDIGWRESADFVDDFGVEFPVIVDSAGDLALRLGSRVTSESFVISTANRIVYRGRIDDRFAAVGRLRTRITSHENVACAMSSRTWLAVAVRSRTRPRRSVAFTTPGARSANPVREPERSRGRVTSPRCSRPTASNATGEAASRLSRSKATTTPSAGIG